MNNNHNVDDIFLKNWMHLIGTASNINVKNGWHGVTVKLKKLRIENSLDIDF